MNTQQEFAKQILESIQKILSDLPKEMNLNEVSSNSSRDSIDINLGDGRSLVLALWGKKR